MTEEKTYECLCLRSIDYKENDKLITLYAFGKGKISATVRGVKKAKAKLKYSSSLLCFAKYYFTVKNGYYNVIGCDLIDSFFNIWQDVDKYYLSLCSLEILEKIADDREIADSVAVLTINFLKDICYKNTSPYKLFLIYLHNITNILGYELFATSCAKCQEEIFENAYYSKAKGCVYCEDCSDSSSIKLNDESLHLLQNLQKNQQIEDYSASIFVQSIKIMAYFLQFNLQKKIKCFEELFIFLNI